MTEIFKYNAPRAREARLHLIFARWLKATLVVVAILVFIGGGVLLVFGSSGGWLLFGISLSCFVPLFWNERHLSRLAPTNGDRIEDRLEIDLLARLPSLLARDAVVSKLSQTRSVQFVMARAGISPRFLGDNFSEDGLRVAWERAIARKPNGVIYGADLLASLVASDSALSGVLPHLQLDQADVDIVASWYSRLQELIRYHSEPHSTGGIARDWSFGYSHLLNRFGVNISDRVASGSLNISVETHADAIDFMTKTLSSSSRANVALVGPVGSGKSTIVEAFAKSLMMDNKNVPTSLLYRQIIQLDASTLISAAPDRGQLERLVNDLFLEAYRAKNIILCLDDAQLFFEDGTGSVDLTNVLRPILEGGVLKVVLTMDEQRFLKISQQDVALTQLLNRFTVQPASYEDTMSVMQDELIAVEFRSKVTYMHQALREAYRLSERYFHDVAQPGRALQVLLSAAQFAEGKLVTATSVQRAVEQSLGVKVATNTDSDEKEMLLSLEDRIHERMINQSRAVRVVSDALRRARAGVRNEKRPIGTFLFLGPTGVGKTELAKSLASVYFEGEDRIVRLDMNEFVSPDDVRRLIADGADDPSSLSAQIIKQPFSVILLDEIEKAHDTVLSTLLQTLDEGILRDIKGREVSFRDAIIIATSNAGAEQIRHHIDNGEQLEQFEKVFENELINSGAFRAEFLNRFDEIVLFRPLTEIELGSVVDLMIAQVNQTLETQKIRVEIDVELKAWLIVNGNDPRLGARPMRRQVQRIVENIMAKRMLAGDIEPGETVMLSLKDLSEEMKTAKH